MDMKNDMDMEELQAVQPENDETPASKAGIRALLERLPALPRFSDPSQRRAAGYIFKFMAVLLVLTLIVRGTSGAALAKVTLVNPVRGEIAEAVTGSATVSARDALELFAPEGLTISELLVGQGQEIQAGDAAAAFDMDEVQEKLARATAELDKLLLDLEKLERAEDADASPVESAQRSLSRAQEDYDAVAAQGKAETADAKKALDAARAKQSESPDTAALDSAKRNLSRAKNDYDAAAAQCDAEISAARDAFADAMRTQTEIDKASDALAAAEQKAEETLLSANRRVEDAETAKVKAQQDYDRSAWQASDTRLTEIAWAGDAWEAAKKKAEENLLSAARRVEDAAASLQKAKTDHGKSTQQSTDAAAQNSLSAVSLRLDIEKQRAVVDALDVLASEGGVLYSDIDGVVLSAKEEGSTTTKEAVVSFADGANGFEALMQADRSDAEQLAVGDPCEVTAGGGSMYYTPTVSGTISAISSPNEQDKRQVTIRLPEGDWSEGQRVEVQVVREKNAYDLCVPLSALHSDNTGYYLLIAEQKNTVLGAENIAAKAYVKVLASDEEIAAVQGSADRNSAVITGSSKAVAAGDRVRVNSQ